MKFVHVAICAVLLSFLVGLIVETQGTPRVLGNVIEPIIVTNSTVGQTKPFTQDTTVNLDDPNLGQPVDTPDTDLKPCSQVNTMPCEVSPRDPLKEELNAKVEPSGLFTKGEKVTCIYPAIFWWTDRREEVRTIGMKCTVTEASEEFADLEPGYQHVQVDCSKDLKTKWSDQPGVGMVKNHKLNPKVRWFASTDCYHFQQDQL